MKKTILTLILALSLQGLAAASSRCILSHCYVFYAVKNSVSYRRKISVYSLRHINRRFSVNKAYIR